MASSSAVGRRPNELDANVAASTSASTSGADASTIFARLHPATYLARFLDNAIRPDGRSLEEQRTVRVGKSIICKTSDGSCMVRLGSTICVAGVKAELMRVSDEERDEDEYIGEKVEETQAASNGQAAMALDSDNGKQHPDKKTRSHAALRGLGPIDRRRLIVGVDLSPMSSARFKSGPPGDEAQVLASRLMRILDARPPFSANSLLIDDDAAQQLSYCLYVDIVCIAYDGNVLDACMLAINGALQDVKRLPNVAFTGTPTQDVHAPLKIVACPLSFSFVVIDNASLLSDPNAFEASMATATITITLDASKRTGKKDVIQIDCSGSCLAMITHQEASRFSATYATMNVDQSDGNAKNVVRVQDENLIKVCMGRAREQCALFKQALDDARQQQQHTSTTLS